MKKTLLALVVVLLAACSDQIPPEAIGPVAEACKKQGLQVDYGRYEIRCYAGKP